MKLRLSRRGAIAHAPQVLGQPTPSNPHVLAHPQEDFLVAVECVDDERQQLVDLLQRAAGRGHERTRGERT